MKIIICGAGRVGRGIAERLQTENHKITIVDADPQLVDEVSSELNVTGVVGHAAYPETLDRADAEPAEMIIAVTQHDEINMVICQVAHSVFSVSRTVARVRARAYQDRRYRDLFARDALPIDLIISPEKEVSRSIIQRLKAPGSVMSAEFAAGRVQLLMLDVESNSALNETTVDQIGGLFPGLEARVVAIARGSRIQVPRSNDKFVTGERVYVSVLNEHASRLNTIFGVEDSDARHVTIIGAGNVGFYVAEELERDRSLRVRLVEKDPARADRAVRDLRRTIVINGDGLDRDILEEAGAARTDYLIAITDDDRTNLLACNLARKAGAGRTIALVNSPHLLGLKKDLGIDAIIDPRALTVSQILKKLRRGRIKSLLSLEDGQAEVIEGVVTDSSPLVGRTLGYDELEDGITAVAVLRGEEVLIPSSRVRIQPGDQVTVLLEHTKVREVETYFRVSTSFFS
ncbi:MAG: Trk system potassium transporter TrkA [Alphaproteobacteria bacterium]|jgi:trk system potassium uptake protein TrkA|nr:Trk system potassium transporter TrkA [Alphaproteobacteria bacterium]